MAGNSGQSDGEDRRLVKPGPVWWLGQTLLTSVACFFIWFGISLLMASYRLTDPFSFIMTFFAASFMILISAVMALGFILRMRRIYRIFRDTDDRGMDA